MTVPKHERLIEHMMDSYWLRDTSITDPDRMRDVVACICEILRAQPRSAGDMGALAWTADWLERKLQEDDEP